ncbi:MAG: adenylate cyclase [Paracoccaceae bacterium]|jgi:adenylate cyclase
MGDGWIVTFASAVDAVTCAMRLQDKMVLEPLIKLRIGIHIGDITHEDKDVFGDGVNVAARLESLCKPGGVTILDAVHGALDGTLRPAFDDGGAQSLKSIARPMRVWARGGLTGAAEAVEHDRKAGFPVLDILPVAVTDTRADLRDLANALTHELETYLGSLRWLRVSVVKVPRAGSITLSADLGASGDRLRLESRARSPDGRAI